MILMMFFLFGLIQHVSSMIKCYTCHEQGNFCHVPLNIEGGEENNENDIPSYEYDSTYVCESDHYIDSQSRLEKIILRASKTCKELDIPNHRRHCCHTDNCNKVLPKMIIDPFIYSNDRQYLPSMILIIFSIIFLYFS